MSVLNDFALTVANADGWRDDGEWWWIGGPLVFFLFWIAVFAFFWFFACRRGGPRERNGIERARDVLADRYARGDISSDEYRERLDRLG